MRTCCCSQGQGGTWDGQTETARGTRARDTERRRGSATERRRGKKRGFKLSAGSWQWWTASRALYRQRAPCYFFSHRATFTSTFDSTFANLRFQRPSSSSLPSTPLLCLFLSPPSPKRCSAVGVSFLRLQVHLKTPDASSFAMGCRRRRRLNQLSSSLVVWTRCCRSGRGRPVTGRLEEDAAAAAIHSRLIFPCLPGWWSRSSRDKVRWSPSSFFLPLTVSPFFEILAAGYGGDDGSRSGRAGPRSSRAS